MIPSHKKLSEDLRVLGIREEGVLMVHSSLRSLGKVEGRAETVIQALFNVLDKRGTLLLPALSYETVNLAHPYFDIRKTPSCVGALSEYFRQREGTLRSIHPTHSVCGTGAQAHELLSGHENDTTPCGPNSPFHKLPHYNGQILFLGCGLRPNTSMHAIEELSKPPYLYGDILAYEITAADGRVFNIPIRRHNFSGYTQRYDRLAQVLAKNGWRRGKVLDADCYLVEAAAMWPAVHQKLQEDPLFFVDQKEGENA
jgi:aminoglycoside 3-N-acetyltransferase